MLFNNHYQLAGKHAFLSASKYSWIRYDDAKLVETYRNHQAADQGTKLHAFAHQAVTLGIKLPRSAKTLNSFVNDVLGYRMNSEQVLYYSDNVFGTADAISFRKDRGNDFETLRIFDLKNGVTKASFDQLLIYAAIFCHEYSYRPSEIAIELRIYQNDEVQILEPSDEDVEAVMSLMKRFDVLIEKMKAEAQL